MIYLQKPLYIKTTIVIVTLLLTYLLFLLPWVKHIELKGYDLLSSLNSSQIIKAPIVIVGVDEVSLNQFPLGWPWPRAIHAKLIDTLNKQNAKSIIFDIVFAETSTQENDVALEKSIEKYRNVTLASDHYILQTKQYNQEFDILPLDMFINAGANYASAQLPLDDDMVIRRVPLDTQKLWSKSLHLSQQDINTLIHNKELYIHYYDFNAINYASYYQAIDPELLPNDYFKDKIVIVGLYSNLSSVNQQQSDSFLTPLFLQSSQLLPGVFIHANIIANYINNDFITPLEQIYQYSFLLLVLVIVLIFMWNRSPYVAAFISLSFSTIIFIFSFILFSYDIWVEYIYMISNLIILFSLYWVYTYIKTYEKESFIKDAFKHYISPQMVDELTKNPELLQLKGERKKVTLLFCDLANFTSVSEQSTPLDLSNIINEYFTLMTHVLHKNSATVDKFIGDAVMAFWGSPLKDDLQENHAVTAAIEMIQTFENFASKQEIFQENSVKLRIGIYTGIAVIGNFGSKERLSYTAIGDTVNTASRLEGANKLTGTSILIGETTYNKLSSELQKKFKKEGKVALKGKKEKIMTFSFS